MCVCVCVCACHFHIQRVLLVVNRCSKSHLLGIVVDTPIVISISLLGCLCCYLVGWLLGRFCCIRAELACSKACSEAGKHPHEEEEEVGRLSPGPGPLYEEIDMNTVMEMQKNSCYSNTKTIAGNPTIDTV